MRVVPRRSSEAADDRRCDQAHATAVADRSYRRETTEETVGFDHFDAQRTIRWDPASWRLSLLVLGVTLLLRNGIPPRTLLLGTERMALSSGVQVAGSLEPD